MARYVRRPSPRGVILVEAALVLPLLVLLTLGLLDYGWVFLKAHEINNAARHGARIGITIDGTNADVLAAVASVMNAAGLGTSGYVVTLTPLDVSQLNKGQRLTVTVSVLYANIRLGAPAVPMPETLRASVSMASEG